MPFETKEASVAPASGLRRGLQLLTGSRAKALERQAVSRAGAADRNRGLTNRILREGVFSPDSGQAHEIAGGSAHKRLVSSRASSKRTTRAATAERAAVSAARDDALKGVLGAGAGVGAGAAALGRETKTASAAAATVASGKRLVSAAKKSLSAPARTAVTVPDAPISEVVSKTLAPAAERASKPLLSRSTKVIGGAVLGGAAVGGALQRRKQAGILVPAAQVKEAFGGALMAGLKGIGQFAGTAAKSIGTAGKAGGLQAAGQAAANAGRSGLHRAGNFISQNPGAGSALVAAPALAAGYAAGRE